MSLRNKKVLVCLNRIRAVRCGAGGLDVVGRIAVKVALLYFDKQNKNNIMLNGVRQHNYFVTRGNYIGYMFRL